MCACSDRSRPGRRQHGVSLVELIVAITLAGVLLGGIWSGWTLLSRTSADPLVARQQLAIAQSLLREIELQPQPGDATAAPTPGRTGYASITDYDGLVMTGITDAEGTAVAGLESYGVTVSVKPTALAGVPSTEGWWILVTVSGPQGGAMQIGQWRARR